MRYCSADATVADNSIRTLDGDTGEVEAVLFLERRQPMYNLTVDEAHTFFVGEGQWLVHNTNPQNCSWSHKTTQKQNQAKKRGWSDADIQDALDNPAETLPAPRGDMATGDPATIHYRKDGHYVIRNDNTGEIVQYSDTNNPNWLDEVDGKTIRSRPESPLSP